MRFGALQSPAPSLQHRLSATSQIRNCEGVAPGRIARTCLRKRGRLSVTITASYGGNTTYATSSGTATLTLIVSP